DTGAPPKSPSGVALPVASSSATTEALAAGDELEIMVTAPDGRIKLEHKTRVDPDGNITAPYPGVKDDTVKAKGLTLEELRDEIRNSYRDAGVGREQHVSVRLVSRHTHTGASSAGPALPPEAAAENRPPQPNPGQTGAIGSALPISAA